MPKVPNEVPQIALSAPNLNAPQSREFGKVGTALEGVGNTVASTAIDLQTQLNRAEAQDAAAGAHAEDQMWAKSTMNQLKLQSPDGYMHDDDGAVIKDDQNKPRTIAQEFYDQANARYQDNQTAMPSALAAQLYKSQALPHFSDQTSALQNDSLVMRAANIDANDTRRAKAFGADINNVPTLQPKIDPSTGVATQSMPNAQSFYDNWDQLRQWGQQQIGVTHNATAVAAKQVTLQNTMADETMRNIYTNLRIHKKEGDPTTLAQDVNGYISLLRGEDAQSLARRSAGQNSDGSWIKPIFSDALDPKQREREIDKMVVLIPQAKLKDDDSLNAMYANTLDAQKNGRGDPQALQDITMRLYQRGASDDPVKKADAADKLSALNAASSIGKLHTPEVWTMSKSAQAGLIAKASNTANQVGTQAAQMMGLPNAGDMGSKARSDFNSAALEMQNKVDGLFKQDSASFLMKPMNEFQGKALLPEGDRYSLVDKSTLTGLGLHGAPQAYSQVSAAYKSLIKSNFSDRPESIRSPLPKEDSLNFAGQLQKGNEEQQWAGVKGLSAFWGKDFQENTEQMIKDGNLPPRYMLMGMHAKDNSRDSGTMLMAALSHQNEIDQVFKKRADVVSGTLTEQSLNAAVAKYFEPAGLALAQSHPQSGSIDAIKAEIYSAGKAATQKLIEQSSNPDLDTAAKQAYNLLIGNHGHVGKTGQQGWFSTNQTGTDLTPRQVGNQTITDMDYSAIQEKMRFITKAENFQKLGAFVPTKADGSPSDFVANFPSQLERSAQWHYSTSPEPGYKITYTEENSGMERVLQRMNRSGKLEDVLIPLSQAKIPPPHQPGLVDKAGAVLQSIKKFVPNVMPIPEARHRD